LPGDEASSRWNATDGAQGHGPSASPWSTPPSASPATGPIGSTGRTVLDERGDVLAFVYLDDAATAEEFQQLPGVRQVSRVTG
jgi:hypothetical protein